MKRIVRLTEGDLHRIVKRSVNRVLRESEIDGDKNFNDAGFVDSISKFCEHPVDMNNYEPSDEDIYGALGEFNPDDLDTDFSDLMSYNQQNESKRRMSRIIKESIRKVLRESEMFDDAGFVNSVKKFCENPVDVYDGDYDPSDDEINNAIGEFNPDDLDTDFSDLMSNNRNESRRRFGRRINEVSVFPNDWKSRRKKPSEEPEEEPEKKPKAKPWRKKGEGIDDWRDDEPDDKSWKDKSKWKTRY